MSQKNSSNSNFNDNKEQFKIPDFFRTNKMKLGGEENDKLLESINNSSGVNNSLNKEKDTTEKVKFLFPDLSPQDFKQVLERAEYNIEKSIDLLKELKQEQNKNIPARSNKRIKKRNYLELIQKIPEKPEEKNEIKNNNNTNNININNKDKEDNNNNDINNNNLDDEKKKLINEQMNFLLNKFSKMKDKSELKNLLSEIGFPLIKPDPEKEKIKRSELINKFKEKVKTNDSLKNTIINLYSKYTNTCEQIKKKQDLIEELSNTLGNLIEVETEQKIRKEQYENDLKEYENIEKDNNDFFGGPKEGC